MKIVELSDYNFNDYRVAHTYCADQDVERLYDLDEYRRDRGAIVFTDRTWYIGCAPKLVIRFDNGATETFSGLRERNGQANREAIKSAMKSIAGLLFSNDDDEPETDMPDIF